MMRAGLLYGDGVLPVDVPGGDVRVITPANAYPLAAEFAGSVGV